MDGHGQDAVGQRGGGGGGRIAHADQVDRWSRVKRPPNESPPRMASMYRLIVLPRRRTGAAALRRALAAVLLIDMQKPATTNRREAP